MKLNFSNVKIKTFLFILTFIFSFHFCRIGIDIHHQGIMLNGALGMISNDGIIYKEYYYHYGPLTAAMHALILLIFGVKLINIHIFTCFIYGVISMFLFDFGRKILNIKNAFFTVLIWLAFSHYLTIEFHPWSSVYIIPMFLLIFNILVKKEKGLIDFLFLGILVGLIFFTRQSVGIFAVFGLVCLSPIYNLKKLLFSFLGLLIVFLVFLVLLNYFEILDDYYRCSFTNQITMVYNPADTLYDRIKYMVSVLFKNLTTDNWFPFLKHHYTPYIKFVYNFSFFSILVFFLYKFSRKFKTFVLKNNNWLSIFIFSFVSLSQLYPVHDLNHSYWSFSPIFPLLMYIFIFFKKYLYKFSRAISVSYKYVILLVVILSILVRVEIGVRRTIDISKDFSLLDVNRFPLLEGMYVTKDFIPFGNELLKKQNKIREIVYFNHFQFEPYLLPFLISKPPIKYFKSSEIDMSKVDSLQNNYRHSTVFFPNNSVMYYMKNKD